MKICTKCHQLKPFEDFNKDKINPTGYKSRCRICSKEDRNNDEFRERARIKSAKFRQSENGKKYTEQYNASDKEKQRKKAWKKTPAGIAANVKYSRSESHREYIKKYREDNPDKNKEWQKKGGLRYRDNPENIAKMKARKAVWYAVKSGKIPRATSLQCSECSNQATGYHHHKGYAKEFQLTIVPLCRNCHNAKHYEY